MKIIVLPVLSSYGGELEGYLPLCHEAHLLRDKYAKLLLAHGLGREYFFDPVALTLLRDLGVEVQELRPCTIDITQLWPGGVR